MLRKTKNKIQREYEVQNIITQTQYTLDKARKEIREIREKLDELILMKIARLKIKLKEERRKKHLKKVFTILFLGGFLILFVVGVVLKIHI